MWKNVAAATLALLLVSPANAGKPTPETGTTNPKVAYVAILPNGARELRLANEDGTGAVRLASTTNNGQMQVSLGPPSDNLLAYNNGGKLHLLQYEVTSQGPKTVSDQAIVETIARNFPYFRFSPKGGEIAYLLPGTNEVYVYDIASSASSLLLTVSGGLLVDLDFSHDGTRIIYSVTTSADYLQVQFKTVPVQGGIPQDLPIAGRYGNFRVGTLSDVIVADTNGTQEGAIKLISPDGSTITTLASGYFPVLRCGDTGIIYQKRNRKGVSLLKQDLSTGLGSTFSGSGAFWPDYFPC